MRAGNPAPGVQRVERGIQMVGSKSYGGENEGKKREPNAWKQAKLM